MSLVSSLGSKGSCGFRAPGHGFECRGKIIKFWREDRRPEENKKAHPGHNTTNDSCAPATTSLAAAHLELGEDATRNNAV